MAKKLFNPKTINKFCSKIEISKKTEKSRKRLAQPA